jgi:hypothetical protein
MFSDELICADWRVRRTAWIKSVIADIGEQAVAFREDFDEIIT